MRRKLTDEEIEDLFDFCYFNEVPYYDVQIEVVDHLASAIEALWESNPDVAFDNAVYMASQQFGGQTGLAAICKEKESVLKKKYRRMLWGFILGFFRLPKVLITIGISLVLYRCFSLAENDAWVMFPVLIAVYLFAAYYLFYHFHRHVKIKVSEGHLFLFNKILSNGVLGKAGPLATYFLLSVREISLTHTASIVFSVITSLSLILLYADCFYLPKKIREHFEDQFPQFKLA